MCVCVSVSVRVWVSVYVCVCVCACGMHVSFVLSTQDPMNLLKLSRSCDEVGPIKKSLCLTSLQNPSMKEARLCLQRCPSLQHLPKTIASERQLTGDPRGKIWGMLGKSENFMTCDYLFDFLPEWSFKLLNRLKMLPQSPLRFSTIGKPILRTVIFSPFWGYPPNSGGLPPSHSSYSTSTRTDLPLLPQPKPIQLNLPYAKNPVC